jgi:MFS-type transporter involved in bile tolerance (Atg22 family)
LIAQAEFARADVGRVVALVTAVNQAAYAFAPAGFGLLRDATGDGAAVFAAAAVLQAVAALILLRRA